MYSLTEVDEDNLSLFTHLLPNKYAPYLVQKLQNKDLPLIILGAELLGQLVGVITGFFDTKNEQICHINFLFVLPKHRGFGIGKLLLKACEHKARKKGCTKIKISYNFKHQEKMKDIFADFLVCQNWSKPELDLTTFYIRDKKITEQKWFNIDPPVDYNLVLFKDVTQDDKTFILANKTTDFINPFNLDDPDELTSLVLRDNLDNKIVGWMVNTFFEHNLYFGRLFINPKNRNMRLFLSLLANSIWLGFENYSPKTTCAIFQVAGRNLKMRRVCFKLLGSLCEKIIESYASTKKLRYI
ncbi:MAG: GNAT family N-acetyltransferase [Candidatus Margulisiibacteriota bacterium]|jgi:GNAT superfamily N-acetyltransferase